MRTEKVPSAPRKSSFRKRLRSSRASVIVEFAITAPLLITIIAGIVGAGHYLTQLPWSAHTAYQLASTLAENPSDIGSLAVYSRLDQLMLERRTMFSGLGLFEPHAQKLFPNSFYGSVNGVEVVGVRFETTLAGLIRIPMPSALTMEFTAPHLAASIDVASITGFQDPAVQYDCCGIRCTEAGSNCGSPTVCYDGSGGWIGGSCPAPIP